jgi:hypothetical protein
VRLSAACAAQDGQADAGEGVVQTGDGGVHQGLSMSGSSAHGKGWSEQGVLRT